jgi:hypothetical protein
VRNTIWETRLPGRIGVEAAAALVERLPRFLYTDLLVAVWAGRPARDAWAWLLATIWKIDARKVVAAAADRETLARWFQFADYATITQPWLKAAIDMDGMPGELVVYRGGRGSPERLAQGCSWTPSIGIAAFYAVSRWQAWAQEGEPVVVRRLVPRDLVLARWRLCDLEVIVAEPGPWSLHATGAEVETLETASLPERQAADAEVARTVEGFDVSAAWESWLTAT